MTRFNRKSAIFTRRSIEAIGSTLLSAVLSLTLVAPVHAETTPIVISDNDWKPWYFSGVTQGKSGFAKDVIRICVTRSAFAPTFRLFPIARMKALMKQGRMEASIFSFKPHRKSFLIYSKEPIFRESYVPFVRANSGTSIKRIEDFNNLRLGHLHGLTYAPEFFAYIQKRRDKRTLDVTTSSEANIQKLVAGKIDVFVDTSASIHWRSAELGLSNQITNADYVVKSANYFFVLSRASQVIQDKAGFMAQFDACVRNLKQTNRYSRIAAQYGMTMQDLRSMRN